MNTKLRLGAWVTRVIHAKLRKNELKIRKKKVINRKYQKEKEEGVFWFGLFFLF